MAVVVEKDMPRGPKRVGKPTPKQVAESKRRLKILREYELGLAKGNLKAGLDKVKWLKEAMRVTLLGLAVDRVKIKRFKALLRRGK